MLRRPAPSRKEEVRSSRGSGSPGNSSPGPMMTSVRTTTSAMSATSAVTLLGNGSHTWPSIRRKRMMLEHSLEHSEQLREAYILDEQVVGRGGFGTVTRARLKSCPSVVRAVKAV